MLEGEAGLYHPYPMYHSGLDTYKLPQFLVREESQCETLTVL